VITSPEIRPTRLADWRVNPAVFIPAAIVRHFPASRLPGVEAAWSPARKELAAAFQAGGFELESSHWNWKMKAERVEAGELDLFAVECEGVIQGLMAIAPDPRAAVLTPGQSVLYVDFLEAAPWNQHAPARPRCFGGVGKVLIVEAVLSSQLLGSGGRVGLHSLPQAKRFYEVKCGMTQLGADPNYHDLVYFEYPEEAGTAWVDTVRILE
jgi:hypothetical protein